MDTRVDRVWLESRPDGATIGINEPLPRISWSTNVPIDEGTIEVSLSREGGKPLTFHADPLNSQHHAWPFQALTSREACRLALRTVSSEGVTGPWSESLEIEAGLLDIDDWTVPFVSPSPSAPHDAARPAYLMRAEWNTETMGVEMSNIVRARVYATAHGLYELEFNGSAVSNDSLAPGWTSYRHRLRYQTYDLTDRIRKGSNVLGAWLADGWYRGRIGFGGGLWDVYGTDVSLLAQVELTLHDGRVVTAPITTAWQWTTSPITAVGLYEGETYDSRLLPQGWSEPFFDAEGWDSPHLLGREKFPAALEAPTGPPVRVTETVDPISVTAMPSGRLRLDFGQNVAGKLRIRVAGPAGHVITLHHAEVIEDGELGTRPLRAAQAIDTFICDGFGVQQWTPRFTTHGFRYAELENWPGEVRPTDVQALVLHSDMQRTGWFESSNPALNRLHENVVWSMRGNFIDIPTDCPQRDERVGWTGDIQVFAPTANFLYSAAGTLTGWLRDLAAEQAEQGHVPQFVPWLECRFPNFPTAAWGDAAVVVPWELYRETGDIEILRTQYASMCDWVNLVSKLTHGTGLWNEGFQLGDWLDPASPPETPSVSQTDKALVATAYHVKTARILADTASLLGWVSDAEKYAAIAATALQAFRSEFISPNGRVVSDTPTSIAVTLVFNLFESNQQAERGGRRLLELVAKNDYRISTGFVGTPIICDALVLAGDTDAAYHLLMNDQCPSWLYSVSMGATTIWERWDSMLPDGTINPGEMTSFNHYALGAVASFMHRTVAGLDFSEPGYRKLDIKPMPGGGLESASAKHLSPLGPASSSWTRVGNTLRLEIEVPPGATALVTLPGDGGKQYSVNAGKHVFETNYRAIADDPIKPVLATLAQ